MVEHSSRDHAFLSASGASRWVNCPPSARMEEGFAEADKSTYAEEGTLAHEFADLELRIKSFVGSNSIKRDLEKQKAELRKHKLYAPEMEEYVRVYVDYVLEQWIITKKVTPDAVLKIEERADFSHIVPEGFGTSDANIIADETLEIIDLKYGKGVKVNASNNVQLRLYALGVLRSYLLMYGISMVKMTIVQPRLDHIDTEFIKVSDLMDWAETVVKPAAELADKGEGECKAGDWCRWCKAKPRCRAIAEYNLSLAKSDFQNPNLLSDEEVLQAYEQSGLLSDWVTSISKYLLETALEGKSWPGYKLVEGRSNRRWKDEEKALELLLQNGQKRENITNTKLKGIGEIEKLVGKNILGVMGLTIKPQGAPTFVPESDKRPAMGIEQAKKDFQ